MEFVSGNVFIREMRFEKAGDVVEGHAHNFDHTTYVARGALRFEKLEVEQISEDGLTTYKVVQAVEHRAEDGHNWVLIKAGVCHRITALADNSIGHCLYAHRTPQGEIVQVYDGWRDAYG